MTTFKKGEQVIVRDLLEFDHNESPTINCEMCDLIGKTIKIEQVMCDIIRAGGWNWLPKWLKPLVDTEDIKKKGYKI